MSAQERYPRPMVSGTRAGAYTIAGVHLALHFARRKAGSLYLHHVPGLPRGADGVLRLLSLRALLQPHCRLRRLPGESLTWGLTWPAC
jgi:hypothetical protein